MATTAGRLALSPFLTGDPIRLDAAVASLSDGVASLAIESLERPGLLPLAPRVALLHSLSGEGGRLSVRWVHLPHAPALGSTLGPVESVVVVTAPLSQRAEGLCAWLLASRPASWTPRSPSERGLRWASIEPGHVGE